MDWFTSTIYVQHYDQYEILPWNDLDVKIIIKIDLELQLWSLIFKKIEILNEKYHFSCTHLDRYPI